MATPLDKNIARESTVKYDGREIQITLTADQKISLKLKGMKSGVLEISISDLYEQLVSGGTVVEEPKVKSTPKKKKMDDDPMISLYELRTNALTTKMDMSVKLQLEKLVCELIRREIKLFEDR